MGINDQDDSRVVVMNEDFTQLKMLQPDGNVPPTPVAVQTYDNSHLLYTKTGMTLTIYTVGTDLLVNLFV